MSNTGQDKPTGKPGQRNRKAERRREKSASTQSPAAPASPEPERLLRPEPAPMKSSEPDQRAKAKAPIDAVVASTVASPIPPVAPPDTSPVGAAAPATAAPVSMQTIANAYRDYTRKSLAETTCFVEQLTGVRSFDKAMEIQTEFARQAYATFVAQSQKICELHSELARQTLKPLERLVTRAGRAAR